MPQTPSMPVTRSTKGRLLAPTLCALSLLVLSACSTMPPAEPPVIGRKPSLTPRPAAVSQIKREPSTEALQRAESWWQNSGALLSDETPK